jgi:hypothetical protein
MIMARRSSLGFFDLSVQGGVFQYPVVRAGCWINMIPAGGLVTVPEGSSSCQCAYNFKTSIALMSDERQYNYGIGGSGTEDRPAVRINFGAPGDRPDRGGRIWLAWPRPVAYGRCLGNQPYGGRVVKSWLQVSEPKSDNKAVSFGRNPDWIAVEGTDEPWLFACGLRGPLHLKIRASDKIPAAKQYKVTLSFCMMPPDERLRRFDVKLDGKTVLEEFELSAGRQAQTRIFTIPADGEVELELVPRSGAEPVINAIEIEQAEDRQ